MKTLLKLLLLATFAVVVFIPNGTIAAWAYWSLFLLMFFLLYLYYRSSYWVSLSDVPAADGETIRFSLFCGKVPPLSSEDLVRGRLVVTDTRVVLYQRHRDTRAGTRVREVWSVAIDDIESFSYGRVIGARMGLILALQDGNDARFASRAVLKKKDALTEAFGWNLRETALEESRGEDLGR